jgi:signal transduction histidine kinase
MRSRAALDTLVKQFSFSKPVKTHGTFLSAQLRGKAKLLVCQVMQESLTNTTSYASAGTFG